MNTSYEKKYPNEISTSSSAVLIDGPTYVSVTPVKVRHYFVFSLFSALCLCPATGLIALAYSIKSSAKADVKFHDKARIYSRRALVWNIVSVVLAVVSLVFAFIFYYQLFNMMRVHSLQMNQQYRSNDMNKFLQTITDNTK